MNKNKKKSNKKYKFHFILKDLNSASTRRHNTKEIANALKSGMALNEIEKEALLVFTKKRLSTYFTMAFSSLGIPKTTQKIILDYKINKDTIKSFFNKILGSINYSD